MRMVRTGLPRLLSCYGCILRRIRPDVRIILLCPLTGCIQGYLSLQEMSFRSNLFLGILWERPTFVEAWLHEPSGEKLINNRISQTVNLQGTIKLLSGAPVTNSLVRRGVTVASESVKVSTPDPGLYTSSSQSVRILTSRISATDSILTNTPLRIFS
jgi:hypothetical protein